MLKRRTIIPVWRRDTIKKILIGSLVAIVISTGIGVGWTLSRAQADPVPYTTTVTNFDPSARQVTRFDVNGNAVDAHDGDMAYFEGKYYLYGTSYDCGYKLQVTGTPFCGFKSYSSTDLVHWQDEGFLFDATTPTWQARCAAPRYGCYRPHILHNTTTDKYVLWINSYDNASGFHVFTADTPQGPFTEQAEPDLAIEGTPGSFVNGDMDLFQDDDGTAYIAYTNISSNPSHSIKIQQLNADYTSGVGTAATAVNSGSEAPSLFRKGSTYYLVYGPTCPYCGGTSTQYKTATSPMGTWSTATQINANSCGGQPSFVSKLPGTSGDTYLYGSDLWNGGNPNQALANYFWKPLGFSGTAINSISCSNTFSLTLGDGAAGQVNFPVNADQSSGASFFRTHCDIKSDWSRSQTFTPGKSGKLGSVSFTTYRNNTPGDLKIDIVPVNNSAVQLGPPLYSTTIPASGVGWSPKEITITPNISVHGGTQYGIVAWSPSTTGAGNCYGMLYNDYKTYFTGQAAYLQSGGAWTAETNRSLKFETSLE